MKLPSGYSTNNYGTSAAGKGWGSGWPNCQAPSTTITVSRSGQRLSVHPRTARLWTLLLNEMERNGYHCHVGWCWGGECRCISGTRTPSNHSWNNAVDINAPNNPYTSNGEHDIPDWVFDLFRRFGFGVGADYSGKQDWMHIEFMGTPGDADIMTQAAEREFAGGATPPTPPSPPSPDTGDFPLPSGYYYGPQDGPTESISGMAGESEAWIEGLRRAQRQLITKGFGLPAYGADGQYGAHADGETHDATVAFQQSAGLEADGLIGPATWHGLFAASPIVVTDPDGWLDMGAKEEIIAAIKDRTEGSQSSYDEQRWTAANVIIPAVNKAIEHSQETRRMLGVLLNWNSPAGPEDGGRRRLGRGLQLVVADDSDTGAVFAFGPGAFYHVPDGEHYSVGIDGGVYAQDLYHTNRRGLDVLQSICLGLPNMTTPASALATAVVPKTYTIVGGDSLGAIATKFNTTVAVLSQLNNITDPNNIAVDQVLTLPKA